MKESKPRGYKLSKAANQKVKQGTLKLLEKKGRVKPTAASSQRLQSTSILTRMVAKGQFQKVPETLVLRAGQTLDLRCKGKAVKWRYPVYLEEDDERRLR